MKKKTVALQGIFKVTLFTITFCTLSNYSTSSTAAIEASSEGGATHTKPSRRVSFPGVVTALEAADRFRLAAAGHDAERAMRDGDTRGVLAATKSAEIIFSAMSAADLMRYLSDSN